jgi:hypothetical protein
MGFISFLWGRRAGPADPVPAVDSTEQRLLALSGAVRDTLRKHGIPASWIGAETLPAKNPSEIRGVHLRLVVKKAEPRLLVHLVALQRAIQVRLAEFDARSSQWLVGTSWRLDVPLGSETSNLPGPDFWEPVTPPAVAAARQKMRETVSQQLAARDRAFVRTTWDSPDFLPTQPMGAR